MLKTMTRLMMVMFAFALIAGPAMAQDAGAAPKKEKRPRTSLAGEVTAVSPTEIAVKDARGTEMKFQIGDKTMVCNLKPMKLAEVTGEKWATVMGRPASTDPTAIDARSITIAEKAPADAKGEAGRGKTTGMLSVQGESATLKAGDQTLKIVANDQTKVFAEGAAKLDDVKVGNSVMVDGKAEGEKLTAVSIGILPAADKNAPAAEGGKKKKGKKKAAAGAE